MPRRAVSAALPFVGHADQVFVVTVGDDGGHEGAEAVTTHLARHGAHATTHLMRAARQESDDILEFAQHQDADLVVMGAYGHTRLREWLFGGVTYEMLHRSPLPCLMCH